MRRQVIVTALLAAALGATAASGQQDQAARADQELRAHLSSLARRVDDPTTDLGVRERLVMEMASTLDRAALAAAGPDVRRDRWAEAARVLDDFSKKNPGHPEARAFQVQAAVYLWARARDRLQAARLDPADDAGRRAAADEFKACADRLRPVYQAVGQGGDVFAQNVRFRFAQALADLAESVDDDKARGAANAEALAALARPVTEPMLQGFARLLRASLLTRHGRFDEARAEADAAAAARPAPPEPEQVEARVAILTGRRDFAGALRAVDASQLDPAEKTLWRARVRLAEYLGTARISARDAAEAALFADLKALRGSTRPEARATLAAAAASLPEPGPTQAPDAWDLLADGAAALDDPARAGVLERKAAEKADAIGRKDQAAAFRLRAGAFLYRAEKFAEADPLLTRVAEDPSAGPARARAGLLRALARGRALALGHPGASEADYAAALKYQVATFPDDPSASEARWLLGRLRLAESDRDGAVALWGAIPHGGPRWLESRVEIAGVHLHDLELQRLHGDREAVARKMEDARSFLAKALGQAEGEIERNEILLASARLELTPGLGRPEEVRRVWEQFQRTAARPDQRDRARRLELVALAASNRWTDADQAARQEVRLSEPAALLPTIRLLDRWAAESESDLRSRRLGYLMRLLLQPASERRDAVPAGVRAEVRLRYARALLFNGDDAGARRALGEVVMPSGTIPDELLRDLADTYTRLEAYELAVDVQRLRARHAATGSAPWFDARYGLALAYYRAGKAKDALHLIDATAILHPDLGGGDLRDKFLRLRQRISPDE
jgi:hypothetical protein